MDEPDAKGKKAAKKPEKAPRRPNSFKVCPLIETLDLTDVGIEIEGGEDEIEWGQSKQIRVKERFPLSLNLDSS